DGEEAEDELGKFFPQKGCLVFYLLGGGSDSEGLADPLNCIGENDEADERVAAGFGEDSVFTGGIGVESAGGGGFGGIVDGEASPDAIGVVAHVQGVADEREG